MISGKKVFYIPEQMAIEEVLHLINNKKMELVNTMFFSAIETTPLKLVSDPLEYRLDPYDPFPAHYVRTTVRFYARGTLVAEVVIEGVVEWAYIPGVRDDILDMWLTRRLRARRYFWRNDLDEPRELEEFAPIHDAYSGPAKPGADEEEAAFESELRRLIDAEDVVLSR